MNIEIVSIRHSNGHISYIKQYLKIFFRENVYYDDVAHVPNFQLSARSSSFFSAFFLHFYGKLFLTTPYHTCDGILAATWVVEGCCRAVGNKGVESRRWWGCEFLWGWRRRRRRPRIRPQFVRREKMPPNDRGAPVKEGDMGGKGEVEG